MAKQHTIELGLDQRPDDGPKPPLSRVFVSVGLKDMAATDGALPESRLGERIRYARNELELNIEALSRLTKEYDSSGSGLSPTSISRYESGESLPGLREFRLVREALDVPMAWLLYGTVEEAPKPEFSEAERFLLYSLRKVVADMKDDANLVSPVDTDWIREEARMEKLNRAKKAQ
jgi:transcriptional regulator with XRE-family HTH domain